MSLKSLLEQLYEDFGGDAFSFHRTSAGTIRGTSLADDLTGTAGNDRIVGMAGADRLDGLAGNDLIKGYLGGDTLLGGAGIDILLGGHGDDENYGGAGNDLIADYRGNDLLFGGGGDDILYASFGANRMEGGTGNDYVIGGIMADLMYGDDGNDRMSGGAGDDEMYGGEGHDRMQGYYGNDDIWGENGNDVIMADGGDDVLRGGAGNDTINKYSSLALRSPLSDLDPNFDGHKFEMKPATALIPGISRDKSGADRLFGGRGDDKIYVGKDDVADGGSGADIFALVFTGLLGVTSARIKDFTLGEDSLSVAYTDVLSSAPEVRFFTRAQLRDDYPEEHAKLDADDLMAMIARTDVTDSRGNSVEKSLREFAIIEDGASLGLTEADISYELLPL